MLLKLHETARRGGYMDDYIYTIGREFGSDGKNVGIALAKKLNIKCYDKELLAEAAKQSGLCEEIFENHDEKPTNSFLYSLVMHYYIIIHIPCQRKFLINLLYRLLSRSPHMLSSLPAVCVRSE